jgi:hypothetical protein
MLGKWTEGIGPGAVQSLFIIDLAIFLEDSHLFESKSGTWLERSKKEKNH